MLFGEAPGPRGADRSGVPFWGDRSGKLVYRALAGAQRAEVPAAAWEAWEGGALAKRKLWPRLQRVALSNAFDRCPTKDGVKFCAPSRRELFGEANQARLRREIRRAQKRGRDRLTVIALGRHAEHVLARLRDELDFDLHYVPHPSPRALASRRRGATMVELEAEWCAALAALLQR